MKTENLLLLGALGVGAYFLISRTGRAVGQVTDALTLPYRLPLAAAAGLTNAAQQLGADVGNALGGLFGQQEAGAQARYESLLREFQEQLARTERIREHEAIEGLPPAGFRHVESDVGIGIMPTAPISPEAVTAGLPSHFLPSIAPERVAYQAAIGIPLLTDAQYRAMQEAAVQQAAPTEQGPPQSVEAVPAWQATPAFTGASEAQRAAAAAHPPPADIDVGAALAAAPEIAGKVPYRVLSSGQVVYRTV